MADIEKSIPNYRLLQIASLVWSVIFGSIIFYGYFLIFQPNMFLSAAGGLTVAIFAIILARVVANGTSSVTSPFFYLLLIISALGVATSLFLSLEGKRIVDESITDSQTALRKVETSALVRYTDLDIPNKIGTISGLQRSLNNEIRNPLNCGQGAVAQNIIVQIQKLLPGFQSVSARGVNCSQNEKVIDAYDSSIRELTGDAAWNNVELVQIAEAARGERKRLQTVGSKAGLASALAIRTEFQPALKQASARYMDLRERLARQGGSVETLPEALPVQAVDALGDQSQLISLVVNRWDRFATYVYLALAVFLDWITVLLFRQLKVARPVRRTTIVQSAPAGRGL